MKNTVAVADIVAELERRVAAEKAAWTKRVEAWPDLNRSRRKALEEELHLIASKVPFGYPLDYGDPSGTLTLKVKTPQVPAKPEKTFCSTLLNDLHRWQRDTRERVSLDPSEFSRIFTSDVCK